MKASMRNIRLLKVVRGLKQLIEGLNDVGQKDLVRMLVMEICVCAGITNEELDLFESQEDLF